MTDGTWTLKKIVAAVKDNLESGLKTTGNYVFSIDMLEHTVIGYRNKFVETMLNTGVIVDKSPFMQEINCIKLDKKNFSLCCTGDADCLDAHFILPQHIGEIEFLGSPGKETFFKVYTDDMDRYNKYRKKVLAKRPYARLRYHEGVVHGFLFNLPSKNLKRISAAAIWANPYDVNAYDCCFFHAEDTRFPIAPGLAPDLIKTVVNDFASGFYKLNYKPNTQQGQP